MTFIRLTLCAGPRVLINAAGILSIVEENDCCLICLQNDDCYRVRESFDTITANFTSH